MRGVLGQLVIACLCAGQPGGGGGVCALLCLVAVLDGDSDVIAAIQIARRGGDGLAVAVGAVFIVVPCERDRALLDRQRAGGKRDVVIAGGLSSRRDVEVADIHAWGVVEGIGQLAAEDALILAIDKAAVRHAVADRRFAVGDRGIVCLDGQVRFIDGIGHAGGGTVHGDAGSIGARVGGECAVFQLLNILARLYVADGDPTRRRTLPIAACIHRGGFAFPAVGQLGGGRNGHAASVRAGASRVCAACGDGRAACRVRPAMLMPGHGERLAVALVAIAALDENVVLIALVYGQPGDRERLALLAGMLRIINIAELRGPVVV